MIGYADRRCLAALRPGRHGAVLAGRRAARAGRRGRRPSNAALRGVLAAPVETCGAAHLDRRRLARFYPGRSPLPLWVDAKGPRPRARRLRAVLERSETEGLPPTRYGFEAIAARWEARAPTDLACLDVLLTTAFDRYGRDLATGTEAPREADRAWRLPPATAFDAVAALRAAGPRADPVARLETLAPRHDLYVRLRAGLARYRRLADEGGWGHGAGRAASPPRRRERGDPSPPRAAPARRGPGCRRLLTRSEL